MFRLEIKTGNAAFRNSFTGEKDETAEAMEVVRILKKVTKQLENSYRHNTVHDINGNTVGEYYFK